MKLTALAAAAALVIGGAAPALAQTSRAPTDTGNMAYPAPLPQGNVGTTTVPRRGTPDTGNMAYPAPQPQGTVGSSASTARRPTDTGNMAYPTPVPQGNLGATTKK